MDALGVKGFTLAKLADASRVGTMGGRRRRGQRDPHGGWGGAPGVARACAWRTPRTPGARCSSRWTGRHRYRTGPRPPRRPLCHSSRRVRGHPGPERQRENHAGQASERYPDSERGEIRLRGKSLRANPPLHSAVASVWSFRTRTTRSSPSGSGRGRLRTRLQGLARWRWRRASRRRWRRWGSRAWAIWTLHPDQGTRQRIAVASTLATKPEVSSWTSHHRPRPCGASRMMALIAA